MSNQYTAIRGRIGRAQANVTLTHRMFIDINFFNSIHRALLGSLSAAVLMAGVMFPVHAQDELIIVEPVRAMMYLNGDIGTDEQQYMRKVARIGRCE